MHGSRGHTSKKNAVAFEYFAPVYNEKKDRTSQRQNRQTVPFLGNKVGWKQGSQSETGPDNQYEFPINCDAVNPRDAQSAGLSSLLT